MNKSTLKYIAKELGISASTVSRAVNGKDGVKEKTRQRVLEAVEKYSYIPNEVARSLQKSSTQTIAVVLPDISETFFGMIVKAIDVVVSKKDYMLILSDTHENIEKERKILDIIYKRRVDALVLATVDCSGDSVNRFIKNGIPVAFIDNIPKISQINAITIDNKKAAEMGVSYMISCGHKNIAAIIGSIDETTGAERLHGYMQALKRNNIKDSRDLIKFGDYKRESGYKAMCELIDNRNEFPFSAVFVTSEQMTYGALRAIRDRGLSVPEDISVVGFDIHNLTDDRRQMITSVRQPEEEIGKKVGELLLRCIDEKENSLLHEKILLEAYLEKGDTVKKLF